MKRCMFVDDSSVIRKVAKRILAGPEMVVIEAATGLDAIEMCAADMPDIIVVDGSLPDMPTSEVIRRIRASCAPSAPALRATY
jgi:two-component system chemotaxis response regulator CheY